MYRASHESRQNEKVHGLAPVTRSRLAASQKSPAIGTRSKQATLCHVLIGKNPRKFPGNHRAVGGGSRRNQLLPQDIGHMEQQLNKKRQEEQGISYG